MRLIDIPEMRTLASYVLNKKLETSNPDQFEALRKSNWGRTLNCSLAAWAASDRFTSTHLIEADSSLTAVRNIVKNASRPKPFLSRDYGP